MNLFQFAHCADYDGKIDYLAFLSPEKWSHGRRNDNDILKNYIAHTFMKVYDEHKVLFLRNCCLFNTGLFTRFYEAIYAVFSLNSVPNRQTWFLDGFYTQFQLAGLGIDEFPKRADYFDNPEELVFDTNCEIIPQYSHIFNDEENFFRIPRPVRESPTKTMLFDGAIKRAKHMVDANYRVAVPQYYRNRIQLLIPICLMDENLPDLALVLNKNPAGNQYLGHTCLTLSMAYNNARLIAKLDPGCWLAP